MKKTTKSFAAILLAVMMLVAMIPTAFAANDYTFTLDNSGKGYSYDVYRVATFAEETGAYTVEYGVDAAVKTAVETSTESTAALLDALNAATNVGTKVGSFANTETSKTFTFDEGGIFYVKNTGVPVASAKSTKNNVIVLDAKTNGTTVDLSKKQADGTQPTVKKTFGDDTTAEKIVGSDTTITYKLTADVTGTAQNKLTKFVINDKMDAGLSLTDVEILSVQLLPPANGAGIDIKYAKIDNTNGFSISVDSSELAKDTFYDYEKVVVTFTTKLTKDAVVATSINNEDSLTYQLESSDEQDIDGTKVSVKTFGLQVEKQDADTGSTLVNGTATFGLYKDSACTQLIEEKTTENGIAKFATRLADGTYYVKELVAPQGYNLNSEVKTVVIDGKTATTNVVIQDTKSKLPETGGAGTMMFTIGGAALILAAGVLFVIVMRKKAAK